jgi:hypothetical protein
MGQVREWENVERGGFICTEWNKNYGELSRKNNNYKLVACESSEKKMHRWIKTFCLEKHKEVLRCKILFLIVKQIENDCVLERKNNRVIKDDLTKCHYSIFFPGRRLCAPFTKARNEMRPPYWLVE